MIDLDNRYDLSLIQDNPLANLAIWRIKGLNSLGSMYPRRGSNSVNPRNQAHALPTRPTHGGRLWTVKYNGDTFRRLVWYLANQRRAASLHDHLPACMTIWLFKDRGDQFLPMLGLELGYSEDRSRSPINQATSSLLIRKVLWWLIKVISMISRLSKTTNQPTGSVDKSKV